MSDERKIARNRRLVASITGQQLVTRPLRQKLPSGRGRKYARMEEALSRHEASKVSRSQPAPCHFVASTRRCHVRIETGRQKDGMLKDIDYRIGQEVQSARLVVPIFSLVAVSPFLSARQRIKRSMHAWDGIMLRCTLKTVDPRI